MACHFFGAITWTNAALLAIGPLGTNFNEIQMEAQNFHGNAFENIVCKSGGHVVQWPLLLTWFNCNLSMDK